MQKVRNLDRWSAAAKRELAFQEAILAIPAGKVSTYGLVAEAAGYPRYHRAVAHFLGNQHLDRLPWHRVLGADGKIKTSGAAAMEQRARLTQEGVKLRHGKVDHTAYLHDATRTARAED